MVLSSEEKIGILSDLAAPLLGRYSGDSHMNHHEKHTRRVIALLLILMRLSSIIWG